MSSPRERFGSRPHPSETTDPEAERILHRLDMLATSHLVKSLDSADLTKERAIAPIEASDPWQVFGAIEQTGLVNRRDVHQRITEMFPGSMYLPIEIKAYDERIPQNEEERGIRVVLAYDVHPPYVYYGSEMLFNTALTLIDLPTSNSEMRARMTFEMNRFGEPISTIKRSHVMTPADLSALYASLPS